MKSHMKTRRVSVVIPTFNSESFIAEALDSVFSQEGFDLQVIVVDDGSEDSTVEVVRGFPGVLCIKQKNRGPASARNTGLRVAKCDYIAFLDSDDLWPDGKLQRQISLMEANPDVALIFGDCRQYDSAGFFEATLFESEQRTKEFWGGPVLVEEPYAKLMHGNFITTGSVVLRKSCLDSVGLFDERYRLVEDLEFWLRIALSFPIAHCDAECLYRRRHDKNVSRDQVGMSTAFIDVLESHQSEYSEKIRLQRAKVGERLAMEYRNLGLLYAREGKRLASIQALMKSFRKFPSLRTLVYARNALVNSERRPTEET